MHLQYIYRCVCPSVQTQGRFGTRHDDITCVDSVHECYVDIFTLQVSTNTGRFIGSNVKVKTNYPKYVTGVVT